MVKVKDYLVHIILWLPTVAHILGGSAGALCLILAKVHVAGSGKISEWWQVLAPVTAAAAFALACTSLAVILWLWGALRMFRSPRILRRGGAEEEQWCEPETVTLIRLWKTVFGAHGFWLLVFLAVWLLTVQLYQRGSVQPVIYPLMPLVVLGLINIVSAVIFVPPEVDPPRRAFIGVSLVAHAAALALKLDMQDDPFLQGKSPGYPWCLVCIPSWFTYAGVILSRSSSVATAFRHESKEETVNFDRILCSVGTFVWAACFCAAQLVVVLRLDGLAMMPFGVAVLIGLVGWITVALATFRPICTQARSILAELLLAAGAELPFEEVSADACSDEAAQPLLRDGA